MYSRVYLEIGNICNMNCSFCHGTKREAKQLSFEEFKFIADALTDTTKYLYFHVMGEPLLHPMLCEFIAYASEKGYKCAITTNGTLLPDASEELLSSGVYKVNISLHSFEDGGKSSHKDYIDSCFQFADKASKKGILTILRLWNRGFDGGRNTDVLSLAKEKFAGEEWRESKSGIRIRDKLHIEYGERFDWPDLSVNDMGNEVFCYGLRDHFGILCDGTVVPCCLDCDGNIPLGNIFNTPIEEILSSPRAKKIKDGFDRRRTEEELCRKCGYARRFG